MHRRSFIRGGAIAAGFGLSQLAFHSSWARSLRSKLDGDRLDQAFDILNKATSSGQILAAALLVRQGPTHFASWFGASTSPDDMFLLASISKPISVAALMTLYDRGEFQLDDQVRRYLPEFKEGAKRHVTIRHLLTHVSGLPDQLANNQALRKQQKPLSDFVAGALEAPLQFRPGLKYRYSSMGILLATEIARRISGEGILEFVNRAVFKKLKMKRAVLGLGKFKLEDVMKCQVVNANPESGSGDPTAKQWDWNSQYWRAFGAPWGGAHASAADLAIFFEEILFRRGQLLAPSTAALMTGNHNPPGLTPRGLGFGVGLKAGDKGCSPKTFGHTGATGTLAWSDPASETTCIVLTTLPGRAANPHPRRQASQQIALAAS